MIWGAIKGALGGIWGYIAAGLAALAGVLLILAKAKQAGKDEVIAETATKEVEHAKQANQIERDVATTQPDDVRKRLSKYSRD